MRKKNKEMLSGFFSLRFFILKTKKEREGACPYLNEQPEILPFSAFSCRLGVHTKFSRMDLYERFWDKRKRDRDIQEKYFAIATFMEIKHRIVYS